MFGISNLKTRMIGLIFLTEGKDDNIDISDIRIG